MIPDGFQQIMNCNNQIKQGTAEKNPGTTVGQSRVLRHEKNTSQDKDTTSDQIEYGVQDFPAEMPVPGGLVTEEVMLSRTVRKQMRHGLLYSTGRKNIPQVAVRPGVRSDVKAGEANRRGLEGPMNGLVELIPCIKLFLKQ